MSNVVIYYKKEQESTDQAVLRVNELIQCLETHHTIKGVFLENENESIELMDLLNSPLSEIDYIYMNKPVEDDFDKELLSQLSSREQFKIRYFEA